MPHKDTSEHGFHLRLSGENAASAEHVGNVLAAMDDLFKEVARSTGLNPDDIRLEVGKMGWVCDGCGCDRPDDHADWTKRDGLDFCRACQSPTDGPGGSE